MSTDPRTKRAGRSKPPVQPPSSHLSNPPLKHQSNHLFNHLSNHLSNHPPKKKPCPTKNSESTLPKSSMEIRIISFLLYKMHKYTSHLTTRPTILTRRRSFMFSPTWMKEWPRLGKKHSLTVSSVAKTKTMENSLIFSWISKGHFPLPTLKEKHELSYDNLNREKEQPMNISPSFKSSQDNPELMTTKP